MKKHWKFIKGLDADILHLGGQLFSGWYCPFQWSVPISAQDVEQTPATTEEVSGPTDAVANTPEMVENTARVVENTPLKVMRPRRRRTSTEETVTEPAETATGESTAESNS
jgi:hypothetical protein